MQVVSHVLDEVSTASELEPLHRMYGLSTGAAIGGSKKVKISGDEEKLAISGSPADSLAVAPQLRKLLELHAGIQDPELRQVQ